MPREQQPENTPTTYRPITVTDFPGVPGYRPDQRDQIIDIALGQRFDGNGGDSGETP